MAEKDVSEVGYHPQERWTHRMETRMRIWRARKFTGAPWGGSGDPDAPCADVLRGNSEIRARGSSSDSPVVIPLPDSPTLTVHLPSSAPLWVQLPPHVSSFDKNCTPSQARKEITKNISTFLMIRSARIVRDGNIAGWIGMRFRERVWRRSTREKENKL